MTLPDEPVGILNGAHVLHRHPVPAQLLEIVLGGFVIVFDQQHPPLTRHIETLIP
jgi:hypothetical protein